MLMKLRRHHNNKGWTQIKLGLTRLQMRALAKRLGIKYGNPRPKLLKVPKNSIEG